MEEGQAERLYCPNCGEPVGASHINIERLVAVCPACDTVFYFGDTARSKGTRRKTRQPADVTLEAQDNRLTLAFPQRIGAEARIGLYLSVAMAIFLGFLSMVLWLEGGPAFFAVLMGLGVLLNLLHVLAIRTNMREVSLQADVVTLQQGPLPMLVPGMRGLFDRETLSLQDVVSVYCEQTEESRRAGQPTRYYHVCLGLADGERVFLLKALPHAYAFYIAQVIKDYLQERQELPPEAGQRLAEADGDFLALDDLLADGEAGHDLDL